MNIKSSMCAAFVASCLAVTAAAPAAASSIVYSNLNVNNQMAAASRTTPASGGQEIEAADDFVLLQATTITAASFIGLVPIGSSVNDLNLEIYRVFPKDSGIPVPGHVPTRANSPSDVAFEERDLAGGIGSFSTSTLSPTFTALNSVLNGINPFPAQQTGGDGSVTAAEVLITVVFSNPIFLPADHYFFVPQVGLSLGNFFWLSAERPISAAPPNTPFPPGNTDLQAWIRNEALQPDWLRIGMDIVGGTPAPAFNMAFQLQGDPTPEPASLLLLGSGLLAVGMRVRRRLRGA